MKPGYNYTPRTGERRFPRRSRPRDPVNPIQHKIEVRIGPVEANALSILAEKTGWTDSEIVRYLLRQAASGVIDMPVASKSQPRQSPNCERDAEIRLMKRQGKSLREIAEHFAITYQRVQQIIKDPV